MFSPALGVRRSATAPRILIVDDDREVHADYERCLAPADVDDLELRAARDALFGPTEEGAVPAEARFELVHAYTGESALALVQESVTADAHYCVAFVDMRIPPGWTGVETIQRIWAVDAQLQIVLCTAYSDFKWDKVLASVGRSEGLHLLRKPFDRAQVQRFAAVLAKKWQLAQASNARARLAGGAR